MRFENQTECLRHNIRSEMPSFSGVPVSFHCLVYDKFLVQELQFEIKRILDSVIVKIKEV